jgi:ribosomal protein S12
MPVAGTAYVDESVRTRAGLYVLAAVIVADGQADWYREALLALLHRGQRRLHWRDESAKRRALLVSAVRHLPHTGAVVIATGVTPRRQERARRKCMERLLTELANRRIAAVVFERRHEELDAHDRAMLAALRRRRSVPAWLRVSWVAAADEPLLWLPDIAAGAASLAEADDATYWEELAITLPVDRFPLT